jgi:hypothetical protein
LRLLIHSLDERMTATTSRRRPRCSSFQSLTSVLLLLVTIITFSDAYQGRQPRQRTRSNNNNILSKWTEQLHTGYHRRVTADPSFPSKSVTEVIVAAGTQFTAEWNRRGIDRLMPEIDFILPAILTAVFGKYYRYVRVVY